MYIFEFGRYEISYKISLVSSLVSNLGRMVMLESIEHWILSSLVTDWLGMKVEALVFGE